MHVEQRGDPGSAGNVAAAGMPPAPSGHHTHLTPSRLLFLSRCPADHNGVCGALPSMASLRRLVLGGSTHVQGRDAAALEAAHKEHEEALQALAEHLPAGCEVEAELPQAGGRWGW